MNRGPKLASEFAQEERDLVLFINQKDQALSRLVVQAFTLYFFTAASAAGAAATTLVPPFKKLFTQVVFIVSAKCTLKDEIATAAMNTGIPTEGFTTHHIFE
jgi:hypothetical protein